MKGIHNLKAGATYQQTFLDENTASESSIPALNAPCFDANGNAVPWVGSPGLNDPANCGSAVSTDPVLYPAPFTSNADFFNSLGCFDLTRPTPAAGDGCAGSASGLFRFQRPHRRQTARPLRAGHDHQRKLVAQPRPARRFLQRAHHSREAEPRLGIAYNIKKTNTVLRVSYARVLETPFNENLVLASTGCDSLVLTSLLGCARRAWPLRSLQAGATSSTPACSRRSGGIWSSPANTSGSTPTTPTTSACWAALPSLSRSNGTTPRFPDLRDA